MVDIVITHKKRPKLEGFSIKVPAGRYTREDLIDLISFEYQWQCDEAAVATLAVKGRGG